MCGDEAQIRHAIPMRDVVPMQEAYGTQQLKHDHCRLHQMNRRGI